MFKIRSDNQDIHVLLKTLTNLIIKNGGWLHDHLVLIAENGDMHLEIDGPCTPQEEIIKLPEDVLVPADHIGLSIENDQFVLKPDTEKLTALQSEIATIMITLFNYSGKVEMMRKTCPWIILQDCAKRCPSIIDLFISARSFADKRDHHLSYLKGEAKDVTENDFLPDTFLKTRVLGAKMKSDDGSETNKKPAQYLMPVVDFLNHHGEGCFFNFAQQDGDTKPWLRIAAHQPIVGSSECYAFYNQMDALDSFVNYFYIDREAPFIRSVPLDIDVDGVGTLKIQAQLTPPFKGKLNKTIRDLRGFMPYVVSNQVDNKQELTISHTLIPCKNAAHALRRVLRVMFVHLNGGTEMAYDKMAQDVAKAEHKIVNTNIDYYTKLKTLIEKEEGFHNHIGLSQLHDLCTLQLTKLYKYTYDDQFFLRQKQNITHAQMSQEKLKMG